MRDEFALLLRSLFNKHVNQVWHMGWQELEVEVKHEVDHLCSQSAFRRLITLGGVRQVFKVDLKILC